MDCGHLLKDSPSRKCEEVVLGEWIQVQNGTLRGSNAAEGGFLGGFAADDISAHFGVGLFELSDRAIY